MSRTRPPSWRSRTLRALSRVGSGAAGALPVLRRALCVLALLLAAPAFAAPSVKAVRIDSFDAGAHVIMELDQPLTPRVFTTANPDRLVIDMPEVVWGLPQTSGPVDSPVIRNFGYAPHMPGVSRLVLDLAEPAQLLGYDLRPAPNGAGHYLDIALATTGRVMTAGPPAAPPARVGGAPAETPAPTSRPADSSAQTAESSEDSAASAAEAAEAARRIVEEEMRRLSEERRRLDERRAAEERRMAEERARFAAMQAAEEARLARLREAVGPNLLRPTVAPTPQAPNPAAQNPAAPPAPAPVLAEPARPAPPPGPLKTERRAETAVRKANAETPAPRGKAQTTGQIRIAAAPASPYAPTLSDVSALNTLFDRPEGQQVAMAAPRAEPAPAPAPPVRKTLVMLDPGHGGKDPGAVRNGIREKDVVLDFAKLLRDKLVASGRYEVHMTRNSDRFVELEDRVESARVVNADILVSIHADALDSGDVSGATAYLISEQGSNERLEQIMQNKDSAGSVGGVILAREDIDIARTLIDLARRTTRDLSKEFADEVIKEFSQIAPVVNRAVRPANYVVLRAPDTPAVLLELGFMSNDADLKRLQSEEWRGKAADATLRALDSWRRKR